MAYQPIMALQGGGLPIDGGRDEACQPGYLVHSAQMDEDKIACCLRFTCFCVSARDVAKRTFIDVYSNGVFINRPCAVCCCCWRDAVTFIYYDNFYAGDAISPGCCKPCCPCPCLHCCNCCGETLGFQKSCGCPGCFGQWSCALCCCCPVDVLAGMAEGQGQLLAEQINQARAAFLAAGNKNPPLSVEALAKMGAPNVQPFQ